MIFKWCLLRLLIFTLCHINFQVSLLKKSPMVYFETIIKFKGSKFFKVGEHNWKFFQSYSGALCNFNLNLNKKGSFYALDGLDSYEKLSQRDRFSTPVWVTILRQQFVCTVFFPIKMLLPSMDLISFVLPLSLVIYQFVT